MGGQAGRPGIPFPMVNCFSRQDMGYMKINPSDWLFSLFVVPILGMRVSKALWNTKTWKRLGIFHNPDEGAPRK